jgi:lysophospholipase L1-like esterase
LPPFFVAGAPVTIQVPRAEVVLVPVALPIGQNHPFNYLSTGDSISKGDPGSDDLMGYRSILLTRLREYYEVPVRMFYRGRGGGPSADGAGRTPRDLTLIQPAYTLIGWGNNDWNECGAPSTCDTVANLRSIVLDVKAANSLPCVATLLPPNVGFDNRAPASRAEWVVEMNGLIKAMALQEGALVVDIHAAFMSAGNLSGLFVDHIHPNPRGYELMAETWFNALTRPRSLTVGANYSQADAFPMLRHSGGDSLQQLAWGFAPLTGLSATGT